jgi:hypothetical protein
VLLLPVSGIRIRSDPDLFPDPVKIFESDSPEMISASEEVPAFFSRQHFQYLRFSAYPAKISTFLLSIFQTAAFELPVFPMSGWILKFRPSWYARTDCYLIIYWINEINTPLKEEKIY